MKKLMTMIAAVATAFGLYAADTDIISGAAFDKTDPTIVGNLTWTKDNGFNTAYWSGVEGVMSLTEGGNTYPSKDRPLAFKDAAHDQFVAIKTTLGNPAYMKVKSVGTQEIGATGLYFDGLVKFTAFDVEDTPVAADGKIAVYLKQTSADDDTQTGLFVRALDANGATNDFAVTVTGGIAADTWYRLTIKAIANIGDGRTGFMVFVDKNAVMDNVNNVISSGLAPQYVAFGNAGKIFVSLDQDDETKIAITGVGFDGQGAIDDIVFTENAPDFAADLSKAGVTVNADAAAFVTGISTNGSNWETTYPAIFDAPIPGGKIYVRTQGDYCTTVLDAPDAGDTLDVKLADLKPAEATFNDVAYTFEEAIDAANAGEPGVLKLLVDTNAIALTTSAAITIDLGGKTLSGVDDNATISADGAIVVSNGTVNVGQSAIYSGTSCVIYDGTFNGTVDGEGITIYGGRFLASANAGLADSATFADPSKTLVADGDTGYLIVGTKTFTVTFKPENGEVDIVKSDVAYGTATDTLTPKIEKPGYTFEAWTPALDATVTSNSEYTATWTLANLTITYVYMTNDFEIAEGDIVDLVNSNPKTFTVEDAITIAAANITAKDYDVTAVDTTGWEAGTKTENQTVTVTLTKKQAGWDDDDDGDGQSAAEKYGIAPASKLANVDAGKLGHWASAQSIDLADFQANPDAYADAYLLNCSLAQVDDMKKTFKFDSITPGEVPTIGDAGKFGNGKVVIYGATTLAEGGDWAVGKANATFYKAELQPIAYNEN